MKKFIGLCLFLLSFAPLGAFADYLEGIEYVRLAQPQPVETGRKIEVKEVFWYSCPHCYHLEPVLNKWLKTKPANAAFVRMPAILNPNWETQGRAFYAFQSLGVLSKVHEAFFNAIHRDHQMLNDEASIADFAAKHGVDRRKFVDAYHSFLVDAQVRNAQQLAERYGVDSVPTFIIDGKFRTNASMAAQDNPSDPAGALMKVVNYLIKKAASERGRTAR